MDGKINKNFGFLLSGYTVSTMGTYLSLVVINLFIYQMTGSAFLVGVFLLLRLVPAFFVGNLAGVAADRFNRKYLMITADICRAILIFSVVFLREDIFPLYFIIFGIAVFDRIYQACMGGCIPNIAGSENVLSANAYLATGRTVALVSGPVLGGFLLSTGQFSVVFTIDAATYIFSASMISLIDGRFNSTEAVKRARLKLWKGLKEGYGYIFARAGLFSIILVRCLDAFGSSALNVGLPIFADKLNGGGAGVSYGLMFAFFGVGEMIGSLFLARLKFVTKKPPELIVGVTIFFMAVFFGIALNGRNLYDCLTFLFLSGVAEGVTAVTYNILLQKSPDDIRGRIVGTSETSVWTSMGIGMFLSGLFAEHMPIGQVVGLFAALIALGSILQVIYWKKGNPLPSIQEEIPLNN